MKTGHAGSVALGWSHMIALPKPEVILTHESDLDGLLSGALLVRLAQKLFGAEVPLDVIITPSNAYTGS